MTMLSTTDPKKYGVKFIGTEGWIFTEHEKLEASTKDILRIQLKDGDVRLYQSKHHHRNFIDGVLSRGQVAAPVEIAQRSATVCHLGTIAVALKRPLKFDPKTEQFQDAEANAMLMRPMRDPWKIA